MGYVAKLYVYEDLPDPGSTFHRLTDGETAFEVINRYYKVGSDAGYENLRFYANGLVQVNSARGRHGIYEPLDEEKRKLQLEALQKKGKFVYVDAATKKHEQILVPSQEFANTLKVSSGSWGRDALRAIGGWVEKAAAFFAFPAGLLVGALACVWDMVAGIAEMIWSLLKGIFSGTLLDDLGKMADAITKLVTDPSTRQKALSALADWLEERWNNPSTVKRWYWRGWIIGYLSATILLTFFSGGEALAQTLGSKMALLRDLVMSTQAGAKAVRAIEAAAAAVKGSKAAQAP
jgi:hypothetical protein